MFSPQINKSDNSKDLMNELANWTKNAFRNDSNGATASDLQVQFAGDLSEVSHQNLLRGWVIGMRQKGVPVLVPTKEPTIFAKNQPAMNNITGIIQTPQALKTPTMQKIIAYMNMYIIMNTKKTHWRIGRTGIDGYTPDISENGNSAVAIYTSTTPPYVYIWNGSIRNIGQNVTSNTPYSRDTSELHTSIDGRLPNDSDILPVISQIIYDKLYVSSGRNINSRRRTDVTDETVQPMGPQLVRHGLPNIDTLNENSGIWIPATSDIGRTPITTHGSTSGNIEGQGTVVGE